MLISELETALKKERLKHGDIQVKVQGTLLPDGFSTTNTDTCPDVFETTVETIQYKKIGENAGYVRLFWQT